MRPSLSLKTLLRTPAKTLITFLLLAAVSFALFSRVSEFAVTNRELNRIAANFNGVGAVERDIPAHMDFSYDNALMLDERIPPALAASEGDNYEELIKGRYTPLTKEDIEAVSALPYINRTSTRYMTAGVSEDGFLRQDSNTAFYSYTQRLVIDGRLSHTASGWWGVGLNAHLTNLRPLTNQLEILANVGSHSAFRLQLETHPHEAVQNPFGQITAFENPLSKSIRFPEFENNFTNTLRNGARYIFTAQFNHTRWLTQPVFPGDRAMQVQWPTFYPLQGQPDNYLELDEFADLRALIELINDDRHTFDMVYTDDMAAILRYRENGIRIVSGRPLTAQDNENGALVCVVSKQFMNHGKLEVGDTITMRLGDTLHGQNSALGAVSVIQERRPLNFTTTELVIVGVYDDFDSVKQQTENPFWNYSKDTVFVPLSLLPETADTEAQKILPSEFSFVVNARDIPKFLSASAPLIEETGLLLFFADDGWAAVESHFAVSTRLSLIAITSIFVAALLTFTLTVYLFIGRKKRDYAIMRALGTTKFNANRSLFVPLSLVALIAVIGGGTGGVIYAGRIIESSLETLVQSGYRINTSIPIIAIIGCALAETALMCGFTLFGLWRLSLNSPLALLQGNTNSTRKKVKKEKVIKAIENPAVSIKFALPDFTKIPRKHSKMLFVSRYTFLRCYRALLKTLLSFLLAAVFCGAIGQFAAMKYSYEDIFESMEITGTFVNGLHLVNANLAEEQVFTKKPYYELIQHDTEIRDNTSEITGRPIAICMTSDVRRFIGGRYTSVEYKPGFNESVLSGGEFYCVLSADLMNSLGLEFGDEVQIYRTGFRHGLAINTVMSDEQKETFLRRVSLFFTVVGRLESEHPDFANAVFLPFEVDLAPVFRGVSDYRPRFTFAEYILADNNLADDFRDYAKWLLGALDSGRSFSMDTGELNSIASSVKLWSALFPVVCAALIITGGLLPGLMVIQSSKEAAIFRILGSTKRRTRLILVLQQLLFCLLGIALGFTAVWLYNGSELFGIISPTIILCAALYLASCTATTIFSAVSVTKHKVLDLLQTKE